MRYKIYVSEDDEEGKEVSALDLYKFLRGKREGNLQAPTMGKSKELVPYEGETGGIQHKPENEDFKSIKKQLCKELQEILIRTRTKLSWQKRCSSFY